VLRDISMVATSILAFKRVDYLFGFLLGKYHASITVLSSPVQVQIFIFTCQFAFSLIIVVI